MSNDECPGDHLVANQTGTLRLKSLPWFYIIRVALVIIFTLVAVTSLIVVLTKNKKPTIYIVHHNDAERRHHQRLVAQINNAARNWTAKYNRFAIQSIILPDEIIDDNLWSVYLFDEVDKDDMLGQMNKTLEVVERLSKMDVDLPEYYDVRVRWPHCSSVHAIMNQGACGSCWAVSLTSMISDRICIHSNGTQQPMISALDLMGCCRTCGNCEGSSPNSQIESLLHWKSEGLVTGGEYGSATGCKPYAYTNECGVPCSPQSYRNAKIPKCERKCTTINYGRSYEEDIYKAKDVYSIYSYLFNEFDIENGEKYLKLYPETLKKEIYLNGPINICMKLHEDFQHYHSGVYSMPPIDWTRESKVIYLKNGEKIEKINEIYGHCVKTLGWGRENGIEYFIMANSWGRQFGENDLLVFSLANK